MLHLKSSDRSKIKILRNSLHLSQWSYQSNHFSTTLAVLRCFQNKVIKLMSQYFLHLINTYFIYLTVTIKTIPNFIYYAPRSLSISPSNIYIIRKTELFFGLSDYILQNIKIISKSSFIQKSPLIIFEQNTPFLNTIF